MKKRILSFLLVLQLFVTASIAFAGDWQNTIGTGISLNYGEMHQKYKVVNDYYLDLGDFNQTDVDYNLTYLLVNKQFGLSFKADAGIGLAIMKSILQESGYDKGLHLFGDFGVGYSFIHSDRTTLGAFVMLGLDYATFKSSTKDEGDFLGVPYQSSLDLETSFLHYSLGADITGVFRFTKHLGIFGSFGARWVMGGKVRTSSTLKINETSETASGSWDINGKFTISPKIGLSWTF